MTADQSSHITPAPVLLGPSLGYVVKPSEVVVPDGVPIGQYRRITRPFLNWTLICDENLQKKQKVCNVSQTIVDRDGTTIFSWSLAATQNGQPFFILRLRLAVGEKGGVQLDLRDGGPIVNVPVTGCDQKVCIAYQPVGPRLRAAIQKELAIDVSYASGASTETLSFQAPFAGLSSALAGI